MHAVAFGEDSDPLTPISERLRSLRCVIEYLPGARSAGDAIEGENIYQHAEHYFRTIREEGRAE